MKETEHDSPARLRVLFIAAEADPFVKVGGLGDVAGSLPLAIKSARSDIDIRLAIPYYGSVKTSSPVKFLLGFSVPSVDGPVWAEVFETALGNIPVYLIAGSPIQPDQPVYGTDFTQDAEKFVFFSLACLRLPEHLGWPVDILHANDWHTAVALHALKQNASAFPHDQKIKSILAIHNLPFMGAHSEVALQKFEIQPAQNSNMPPWSRSLPMPMGINAADQVIAVSPTYAKEILTPGYGCDLQSFLKTRKSSISGILNGIDYNVWNPSTDPLISTQFDIKTLNSRTSNKISLQKECSLDTDQNIPLLAYVGRLDVQKGIDLLIESIRLVTDRTFQLIVLGTGLNTLEKQLSDLQVEFKDKIRFINKFDPHLSHRVYSGADILLMPSRYEPCGLAQLIAMRYGCIPVANATGGLKDTIHDFSMDSVQATGFLSPKPEITAFSEQINLSLSTYQDRSTWQNLQKNAMMADFSWNKSARKYLSLYEKLKKEN
jgi:starch synthase